MSPSDKPSEIKARLKVRFKDAAAFISEYNHNIKRGGIFVRTAKPLAKGSMVEIMLILPETGEEIVATGEVMHVVSEEQATKAQPAGMGVEIKNLEAEQRAAIEDFIKSCLGDQAQDLERREHKRFEARIRVRFGSLEALIEEYLHNISHGGIYIRTDKPKPLHEKVKIILSHPETSEEMILDGEVVRVVTSRDTSGQPAGMGVRFLNIDNYTRDQLQAFINSPSVLRNKKIDIEEN